MSQSKNHIKLESGNFYHIYNHANGIDNLFNTDRNFSYFLNKYKLLIEPFAETYAYCLMPNHFHILVKIKDEAELQSEILNPKNLSVSELVSNQFRRLFTSYAKSINEEQMRAGSLFRQNFKRINVKTEYYLIHLIYYIHANPVYHGFVERVEEWDFSSYHEICAQKSELINWEAVLDLFLGKERFVKYHESAVRNKLYFEG